MSGRQKRLLVILVGLTALASAAALILTALEENIVFFHSPS
ncbi:MAG: cytochrome c biogenesis protein CcmE, partial [Alphaproteobacteria bacterium]|nr:cytochrome c biogenesis protein CcmE [Alphaproteobacteria bacterium]